MWLFSITCKWWQLINLHPSVKHLIYFCLFSCITVRLLFIGSTFAVELDRKLSIFVRTMGRLLIFLFEKSATHCCFFIYLFFCIFFVKLLATALNKTQSTNIEQNTISISNKILIPPIKKLFCLSFMWLCCKKQLLAYCLYVKSNLYS